MPASQRLVAHYLSLYVDTRPCCGARPSYEKEEIAREIRRAQTASPED